MMVMVFLGLALIGDATSGEPEGSSSRLAVIQKAPDFALTTQDDKPLRIADVRGKVLLVSFIFTTCNGSCPATTHRMGQVQEALKARGLWKSGDVKLLSISLDPARDTPEVRLCNANAFCNAVSALETQFGRLKRNSAPPRQRHFARNGTPFAPRPTNLDFETRHA